VGATFVLALTVAEGARRLLTPREPSISPAPVLLADYFSPEEIDRGRRYARPQRALGLTATAINLAAIAALTLRPPPWLHRAGERPVAGAAAAATVLSLGFALLTLPVTALARRLAIAAGLDTQDWAAWARDQALAGALQSGFATGAGAGVIAATRRWPQTWWVAGAAGSVGFGAVLAALAPVLLAPIFNEFTPLPEGETRGDVLALADAAGVTVGELYSVDASRRTTAANAYVTGLGPTKRVVLYDTLLDRYGRDEIRVVVAHELGHVHFRDVPRSVVFAAVTAPAVVLAVQRLSWALSRERGTPAMLPGLALATGVVSVPLGMIGNRLSRAVERRADHYSLQLTGASDAFISFEHAIALQNMADLTPPRWVTTLMASHPPTGERIGAAVAFAQREPQREHQPGPA